MSCEYEDIINLPHHVSATRPRMRIAERAAQFSPFAALTGYESAIRETARLTDKRIELDESARDELAARLSELAEHLDAQPETRVTWFCPDERKTGGSYVTSTGVARRIDEYAQILILADGTKIPLADIVGLRSTLSG